MTTVEFTPFYSPRQMLALGVFDGGYFKDDMTWIPPHWKINPVNKYAPNVGQSRAEWQAKGWIDPRDPLGWFQWYLMYYNGRRIPDYDAWQIGRWASFGARHSAQILKNGGPRLRQRQGLLHWSHNPEPDRIS